MICWKHLITSVPIILLVTELSASTGVTHGTPPVFVGTRIRRSFTGDSLRDVFAAVVTGDIEDFKALAEGGRVDICQKDANERTFLFPAATACTSSQLETLLEVAKANCGNDAEFVNQRDASGMTALMYAVLRGNDWTVVEKLVTYHADLNLVASDRQTAAIDLAAERLATESLSETSRSVDDTSSQKIFELLLNQYLQGTTDKNGRDPKLVDMYIEAENTNIHQIVKLLQPIVDQAMVEERRRELKRNTGIERTIREKQEGETDEYFEAIVRRQLKPPRALESYLDGCSLTGNNFCPEEAFNLAVGGWHSIVKLVGKMLVMKFIAEPLMHVAGLQTKSDMRRFEESFDSFAEQYRTNIHDTRLQTLLDAVYDHLNTRWFGIAQIAPDFLKRGRITNEKLQASLLIAVERKDDALIIRILSLVREVASYEVSISEATNKYPQALPYIQARGKGFVNRLPITNATKRYIKRMGARVSGSSKHAAAKRMQKQMTAAGFSSPLKDLFQAVIDGRVDTFDQLLSSNIHVCKSDSKGKTFLFATAVVASGQDLKEKWLPRANECIRKDPTFIDRSDDSGMTALMYGVLRGNDWTVVDALLENHADPSLVASDDKTTALDLAAERLSANSRRIEDEEEPDNTAATRESEEAETLSSHQEKIFKLLLAQYKSGKEESSIKRDPKLVDMFIEAENTNVVKIVEALKPILSEDAIQEKRKELEGTLKRKQKIIKKNENQSDDDFKNNIRDQIEGPTALGSYLTGCSIGGKDFCPMQAFLMGLSNSPVPLVITGVGMVAMKFAESIMKRGGMQTKSDMRRLEESFDTSAVNYRTNSRDTTLKTLLDAIYDHLNTRWFGLAQIVPDLFSRSRITNEKLQASLLTAIEKKDDAMIIRILSLVQEVASYELTYAKALEQYPDIIPYIEMRSKSVHNRVALVVAAKQVGTLGVRALRKIRKLAFGKNFSDLLRYVADPEKVHKFNEFTTRDKFDICQADPKTGSSYLFPAVLALNHTALVPLIQTGQEKCTDGGSFIDWQDKDGMTALMFLAMAGTHHDNVVQLLTFKADPNIVGGDGKTTALDLAAERLFLVACSSSRAPSNQENLNSAKRTFRALLDIYKGGSDSLVPPSDKLPKLQQMMTEGASCDAITTPLRESGVGPLLTDNIAPSFKTSVMSHNKNDIKKEIENPSGLDSYLGRVSRPMQAFYLAVGGWAMIFAQLGQMAFTKAVGLETELALHKREEKLVEFGRRYESKLVNSRGHHETDEIPEKDLPELLDWVYTHLNTRWFGAAQTGSVFTKRERIDNIKLQPYLEIALRRKDGDMVKRILRLIKEIHNYREAFGIAEGSFPDALPYLELRRPKMELNL